jgi:hypothetical protein
MRKEKLEGWDIDRDTPLGVLQRYVMIVIFGYRDPKNQKFVIDEIVKSVLAIPSRS